MSKTDIESKDDSNSLFPLRMKNYKLLAFVLARIGIG